MLTLLEIKHAVTVFLDAHISSYMHSLFPVQFILCSRRSDNKARRSDGGERELNRTLGKRREKKEGRLVFPLFLFFPL